MSERVLRGRYQLGEPVATGGMGTVYRGRDLTLDRPVAIKVLKRALAADPTFVERFRREARAAALLSHPNVAAVFDYAEDAGDHFIVMELVAGETLAHRLARDWRLPWQEAFRVGEQVAAALSAAHERGLVHRDVKPGNVLIMPDGHVKVTDFGIALLTAQTTRLTGTGSALGTASYVAPEQARGEHVGPAADLYSLGCVLFEAVTGSTPYTGSSQVAIAMQHVSSPVPDPRRRLAALPDPVAELIIKAMQKEPGQRFSSARHMAEALAAVRAAGGQRTAEVARLLGEGEALAGSPATGEPGPDAPTQVVAREGAAPEDHPTRVLEAAASETEVLPAASAGSETLADAARARAGVSPVALTLEAGTPLEVAPPRRRLWPLAVALLLAAALLVWLWASGGNGGQAPPAQRERPAPAAGEGMGSARVRVPAGVVGASVRDAVEALASVGLNVEVRDLDGGRVKGLGKYQVVDVRPAAGMMVRPGATVTLLVDHRGKDGKRGGGREGRRGGGGEPAIGR